jgi:hypothetical protein
MLERLKRTPYPFHITWVLWSDWLTKSLQVGIQGRRSQVRAQLRIIPLCVFPPIEVHTVGLTLHRPVDPPWLASNRGNVRT